MNEQIKQQQQWLWDHGYAPKDKTEKQFVDGIDGPMTQAALRLAKERNWEFVNGTPTYKAKWPSVPENTLIKQFNSNLNSAKKSAQSQVEARNKENKKYGSTMRGNQKKFTIELQRDLKNSGYKLGNSGKNKDGVDGIWGKNSNKALNQAIKDGYEVVNNRLVKKSVKNSESTTMGLPQITGVYGREGHAMNLANKWVKDRIEDVVNYVGRNTPGVSLFVGAPYEGSEEEARKLGYEHYTNNGFIRNPVDYSVPNQQNLTTQERAQAQLDNYGITSEQVRDKSSFGKWVYEYAPGHGYNLFRLLENSLKGNKVRENGKRVLNPQPTPMSDALSDFTASLLEYTNNPKMAQIIRDNKGYNLGESQSRNDLSNLYFGYPMQGKSLRISERTETGKGNKPKQGYFYEFTNAGHIYNDPAYRKAKSGGNGVSAQGENMGSWGASIDSEGNKAYYDLWDINPLTAIPGLHGLSNVDLIGTGFELYGKQKRK